jgi:hypothetical protein
MLKSGLLNPVVLHLLDRIRHTNTLVFAHLIIESA